MGVFLKLSIDIGFLLYYTVAINRKRGNIMAKKGLITSLILGAIVTLSLGIYTLVSAIVANNAPNLSTYAVAYTSDQTISEFSNYSVGAENLSLEYAPGQEDLLIFNANDNTLVVDTDKECFAQASVGTEFVVHASVVTNRRGHTDTYVISIYKQGSGVSVNDPFIVANATNLEVAANKMTEPAAALLSGYINFVEDIDLAGYNWLGLAQDHNSPFTGTINANGHTVKNMSININADNYADYIDIMGEIDDQGNDDRYVACSVGFIRNTVGATINALSLENAEINISKEVLEILTAEDAAVELDYIRVGLLVGDARNTVINGGYTVTTTVESEVEGEAPTVTTTDCTSTISGTINGYSYGTVYANGSLQANGIGGIAGLLRDFDEPNKVSAVSNYSTTLTVNNVAEQESNFIGAVAGEIISYTGYDINVENIKANLTSDAIFNNDNRIGAVSGYVSYVNMTNVSTTASIRDTSKTYKLFSQWYNNGGNVNDLSYIAGIAATAHNSKFENIQSNAAIEVYAYSSAGFVRVSNSSFTNVIVNGRVVGFKSTGFAQYLYNSNVNYTTEENTQVVSVALSGLQNAGFAQDVKNSNIVAANTSKVNVAMTQLGIVKNFNIQSTMSSAGLVGYFYLTEDATQDYTVSGFDVIATVANSIDAAGLVAYMGHQTDANHVAILENCNVVANIASDSSTVQSTTHKVAGAVNVVYGNAIVRNNNVTINFNTDRANGNKYGAAMFGGLVSRIAGSDVVVSGNTVAGSAYINYTAYKKSFGTNTDQFEQILAGGLVGVVASYGREIEPGKHSLYGNTTPGVSAYTTYDDVANIDTSTGFDISNNNVAVNITIDWVKTYEVGNAMTEGGYRARSVGSLIGLLMNGNDSDRATACDLSSNTVSGTVSADSNTFAFHNAAQDDLSSMGYGNLNGTVKTAECVGSSYALVCGRESLVVFPTAE